MFEFYIEINTSLYAEFYNAFCITSCLCKKKDNKEKRTLGYVRDLLNYTGMYYHTFFNAGNETNKKISCNDEKITTGVIYTSTYF